MIANSARIKQIMLKTYTSGCFGLLAKGECVIVQDVVTIV
jgi:hypothetical protein